jgi:hypothetical protein
MFEVFHPSDRSLFEDYKAGATYLCGSFSISEDEIIALPSSMIRSPCTSIRRSRPATLRRGHRQRLAHYGMRHAVVVENFLPHDTQSPGRRRTALVRPVRPRDTLTLHITVSEARRSRPSLIAGCFTRL